MLVAILLAFTGMMAQQVTNLALHAYHAVAGHDHITMSSSDSSLSMDGVRQEAISGWTSYWWALAFWRSRADSALKKVC